jgi:hypothetical protein
MVIPFLINRVSTVLILLLVCVPLSVCAQKNSCSISGTISTKNGETYPYSLKLDISGQLISGVSVTQQDGVAFSAKVKGVINKDKKIMLITETASVTKLADSIEMCFINAVLNWKSRRGKYIISGFFIGKDKKQNKCSEGNVSMEIAIAECSALSEESITPAPPPIPMATVDTAKAEPILPDDPNKITEGRDKKLEWDSNTCTIEIWDAGVVDGDVVTILLNGKEILTDYTLTGTKKLITVPLSEKVNTITLVAGDEGNNPPNTANLVLTDGDEQHKITAFNKKGKTAAIVVTRK